MQNRQPFIPPSPPSPPTSIECLNREMLGALTSGAGLYQGAIRYWFMWRMPQLINIIRSIQGLKFHLCCSSYQDLLSNYIRLFLLPDLLVIGQCGPLLSYELLQYNHGIDRRWPNVDGTQPGLGIFSVKPDRPMLDGFFPFIDEWIRPMASTGRVIVAPWTTLLAGPSPKQLSPESIFILLQDALKASTDNGLSGSSVPVERWQKRLKEATEDEKAHGLPIGESLPGCDLDKQILQYGRFISPGAPISIPDVMWSPIDILTFEFLMSNYLETMLLIAGDWYDIIPKPTFTLNLKIPYIDGLRPGILASVINSDPEAFDGFRKAITTALGEAVNARGSESFTREIQRIQKDIIDNGIDTLKRKWKEFQRKRLARFGAYTVATLGLEIGLYFAPSIPQILGPFFATGVSFFNELEKRIAEKGELRNQPMYFIWKLRKI